MIKFTEKIEQLILDGDISKALTFFTTRKFGGLQLVKSQRYFLQMKLNHNSGKVSDDEFERIKNTFALYLRKFAMQLDEPNSKAKHTGKSHIKNQVKFKKR